MIFATSKKIIFFILIFNSLHKYFKKLNFCSNHNEKFFFTFAPAMVHLCQPADSDEKGIR
jgi:hypothetical protein